MGVLALTGGIAENRVLSGIRSDYIPMAPKTALCFVLLSLALAAIPAERRRPWLCAVAIGAAGIVAALVLLRLAEYALARDLGVRAWFPRVPAERVGLAPVGRMAL